VAFFRKIITHILGFLSFFPFFGKWVTVFRIARYWTVFGAL